MTLDPAAQAATTVSKVRLSRRHCTTSLAPAPARAHHATAGFADDVVSISYERLKDATATSSGTSVDMCRDTLLAHAAEPDNGRAAMAALYSTAATLPDQAEAVAQQACGVLQAMLCRNYDALPAPRRVKPT